MNTTGVCAAGDWAEGSSFLTPAGTFIAGSSTFVFSAVWDGAVGGTYSESATFILADTIAGGSGGGTVNFDLDFGQAVPPSQVTVLDASVSGT